MIPKRIFYVWGYGEEKSRLANICIENWRMMMPDFEIVEVNEKTPQWFDFEREYNDCLWFKTVYDLKMWAYVADYVRVNVLNNHGGIYFDTDITVYKDFTPLLDNKMFIGNVRNNLPELAVVGAEKNHKYLKDLIEFYRDNIWKSPAYIITSIFKEILETKYNIKFTKDKIFKNEDITIYSPEYLCPYHYGEVFTPECIKENTYSVHWENSSWITKRNLYFLSNKHRLPLNVLLKQMEFIEKVDAKNSSKEVTVNDLISVIMPCKNGEKYIKEAIQSIKAQKMNTEIIVIDDGSNDNTSSIAKELGCIVIRNQESKGPVIAKNQALNIVKGKYIIFCDSDDIMRKNILQKLYEELNKDKDIFAVEAKVQDFISQEVNEEEKAKAIIKKEPYWGLFTCAILMRKEIFDIIGLFNENVKAGEIIDWQGKMEKHNLKIKKLDLVSTDRRIHLTNFGRTQQKVEYKDYASLLRAKLKA